jgi:hypothetical protein
MTLTNFRQGIDEYFALCGENGDYPDEAGLILHLGLDKDEFDALLTGGSRKSGYRRAILDSRLRRESIITRDIYTEKLKSPTGKLLLSPQLGGSASTDEEAQEPGKVIIEVVFNDNEQKFD